MDPQDKPGDNEQGEISLGWSGLWRRRTACDDLQQPVAGSKRDAVGKIAPGPLEHSLRHVIFLADRADLDAIGTPDAPQNLDMLLVRLGRGDADLAVDCQVGLPS